MKTLFKKDRRTFRRRGGNRFTRRHPRRSFWRLLNFLLLDEAYEPPRHAGRRGTCCWKLLGVYTGHGSFCVSHDRYFIDNLATRVFEIEEGHVHVYPGNLRRTTWWRKARVDLSPLTQSPQRPVAGLRPPPTSHPVSECPGRTIRKKKSGQIP